MIGLSQHCEACYDVVIVTLDGQSTAHYTITSGELLPSLYSRIGQTFI